MDMKKALKIMSEQPDGHFTWKNQIIALYNVLSSDDLEATASVEEILERVEQLEPVLQTAFYSVKVDFRAKEPEKPANYFSLHYKVALSILFFMIYLLALSSGDETTANGLTTLLKIVVEALTNI